MEGRGVGDSGEGGRVGRESDQEKCLILVTAGGGGGMETANHHGMYILMQQSCSMQDVHMYPTAQIQLKKKISYITHHY